MRITRLEVRDIRFPTSKGLDGSDAMNPDPDYSSAYVILHTDTEWKGYGSTFTIGRGNDVVCAAVMAHEHLVVGLTLEEFRAAPGAVWRRLNGDSQLRWIGPDKGAIHLALAAIVNALWDLYARHAGMPVWKLVSGFTPEEFVACVDFRYLTDAITPAEALDLLRRAEPGKAERIARLEREGYPAYTTSAGWLGYPDDKIRRLCREAVAEGWNHIKVKVGRDLQDDIRRLGIIREEIGWDRKLMVDANQVWDVPQAIEWMQSLAAFKPWWIEEPTSPDDVLGHAAIARAMEPLGIGVATGEHGMNRILFKQLLQARAISFCQIDSCRLGREREPRGAALGGEVRCAGVPARRWGWVVRVRSAHEHDRFHLGQWQLGRTGVRVCRSLARALHRSLPHPLWPLPGPRESGLQHRDARRDPRSL